MAKFTNSVLRVLNRIYRFGAGGPQGVDRLDLTSSVTTVHDLSRESELGSGQGVQQGYFAITGEITHGVGPTVELLSIDPFAELAEFVNYPADQLWCWLMSAACLVTNDANFTNMAMAVALPEEYPGVRPSGAGLGFYFPVAFLDTNINFCDLPGTGSRLLSVSLADAVMSMNKPLPFPISVGSRLTQRSAATNALTVLGYWMVWVAPFGVTPPGIR